MIEIDNLHKRYRTADGRFSEVLKGLSLRVPTRSITAVVGAERRGKIDPRAPYQPAGASRQRQHPG